MRSSRRAEHGMVVAPSTRGGIRHGCACSLVPSVCLSVCLVFQRDATQRFAAREHVVLFVQCFLYEPAAGCKGLLALLSPRCSFCHLLSFICVGVFRCVVCRVLRQERPAELFLELSSLVLAPFLDFLFSLICTSGPLPIPGGVSWGFLASRLRDRWLVSDPVMWYFRCSPDQLAVTKGIDYILMCEKWSCGVWRCTWEIMWNARMDALTCCPPLHSLSALAPLFSQLSRKVAQARVCCLREGGGGPQDLPSKTAETPLKKKFQLTFFVSLQFSAAPPPPVHLRSTPVVYARFLS